MIIQFYERYIKSIVFHCNGMTSLHQEVDKSACNYLHLSKVRNKYNVSCNNEELSVRHTLALQPPALNDQTQSTMTLFLQLLALPNFKFC